MSFRMQTASAVIGVATISGHNLRSTQASLKVKKIQSNSDHLPKIPKAIKMDISMLRIYLCFRLYFQWSVKSGNFYENYIFSKMVVKIQNIYLLLMKKSVICFWSVNLYFYQYKKHCKFYVNRLLQDCQLGQLRLV